MTIDFFQTSDGLDKRAIQGGVYHVELVNKETERKISLYIGESAWIVERCGIHLYAFYDDPRYFGLQEKDLIKENLILKFSVLEDIKEKKSVLGIGSYKQVELDYIRKEKPLTQFDTSDNQIRNIDEKVKRVQNEMKKLNFYEC